MAEPVGILLQVNIDEHSYKSFFRSKAITAVSQELFECLHYNYQDYYFYKYNRKKEKLICLAFYNHGNIETITGSFYQSLKTLSNFAEGNGFIAITLDAYNWLELESYEVLSKQGWKSEAITHEIIKEVQVLAYFCLEHLDKPFVEMITDTNCIDSNLLKKVKLLQEKNRLANLETFAQGATSLSPIHLFGNYYYNGKAVFTCKNRVCIYPQINLATFKPTIYGAADDKHVIFNSICLTTNPKKFKRIANYDIVYYLSEEGVLDQNGKLIEPSDSKTFKFVDDLMAEDSLNLYFYDRVISKDSFKEYRIEKYSNNVQLLITDHIVYYHQYELEVDAKSFVFVDSLRGLLYSYHGFIGEDKEGKFIFLVKESSGQLLRCQENNCEELIENFLDKYGNRYKDLEESERVYLTKSDMSYLDEFKSKSETPSLFYEVQEIKDYAKIVLQKYFESKDIEILKPFWRIYDIAEKYFWIEPALYKVIAVFYCVTGETNKALEALRKAISYGASQMKEFFEEEILLPLRDEKYFLELQQYVIANKQEGYRIPMQLEILEKILSLPTKKYLNITFLWKYHLYDNVHIEETMKANPEMCNYWQYYMKLNQELFNRFFKRTNIIDMDYAPYKDYSCMPIEAHINMMSYYAQMGDAVSGCFNYIIPQLVSQMNRIKEKINNLSANKKESYTELYNNNSVVQILEQYL